MRQASLLFLWHMHQPFYRRAAERNFALPWVRLHAVKDYYPFALLLSRFPHIRATFNFSGVLLEQLQAYEKGASDYYLELSKKKPSSLSAEEARFICRNFFRANFDHMIKPYPRYLELYEKYAVKKHKKPSLKDLGDLQFYFNFAWFHSLSREQDKNLSELAKRGSGFSQNERQYVIKKQKEIIKKVIPLYKSLLKRGQIEISLTPYYHPIMPLLCDSDAAKETNLAVPKVRFAFPQDAQWHLAESRKLGQKIFGRNSFGSWPSEGSVSGQVLDIYEKEKFLWIATDEDILFRSLSQDIVDFNLVKSQRHLIYQHYQWKKGLNILFRDKNLSDAIGFAYHHWPHQESAAEDFLNHCRNISLSFNEGNEPLILIAMDGENAWEHYENNARFFFEKLYSQIAQMPEVRTDTISGYLQRNPAPKKLKYIASGSWINANFGVWIGSKENNYNWQVLQTLRQGWEKKKNKLGAAFLKRAIGFIRIIEGSDWNWWNTFSDDGQFKDIFLSYLKSIQKILRIKIPTAKK